MFIYKLATLLLRWGSELISKQIKEDIRSYDPDGKTDDEWIYKRASFLTSEMNDHPYLREAIETHAKTLIFWSVMTQTKCDKKGECEKCHENGPESPVSDAPKPTGPDRGEDRQA